MVSVRFIYFSLLLLVLACVSPANAQIKCDIQFNQAAAKKAGIPQAIEARDSLNLSIKLRNLLGELQNIGFLEAAIDSLIWHSSNPKAILHTGKEYKWLRLEMDEEQISFLKSTGLRFKLFENNAISPAIFSKSSKKILQYASNNGYPFAALSIKNPEEIKENLIRADLNLDLYKLILFDSLRIAGSGKISNRFMQDFLQIKPGLPYDEEQIIKIDERISNLSFIDLKSAPKVYFYNDKAIVDLLVEDVPVNQFDGIVGVFPNSNNEGKLKLTGDLNLRLVNSFKRGELLDLKWKSIQSGTQNLRVHMEYPYVLRSRFGLNGDFHLFYRDSAFLELIFRTGVDYLFDGSNRIQAFYQQRNYTLLQNNVDSSARQADIESNFYGLQLFFSRLNDIVVPKRGYQLNVELAVGDKLSSAGGTESRPSETQSTQYKLRLEVANYLQHGLRFSTKTGLSIHSLFNEQFFSNEALRFGGFNNLMGFDEESLLATSYAHAILEERYFFQERSYFSLFINAAWYTNGALSNPSDQWPFGFGGGMNFDLDTGIFSLYYALGKEADLPLQFRTSKIHFGYTYFL